MRSELAGPGTDPTPITERVNPETTHLDRLPLAAVLERIVEEDAGVPDAVRRALPALERAATAIEKALRAGGRWFNVGAGTSGRLGVVDAAEIPPTFGLPPERVQAILAGGREAFARAVEGAEDDGDSARRALDARGVGAGDVVVVLSASGRTPFVLAGAEHARAAGAVTIGVACDAEAPLLQRVDFPIPIVVGPEVIAGSTRMKGGLAQKMVLHALSTAVMVRLGRVRGNLMSELRGVNAKLEARAVSVVARLAHIAPEEARCVLRSVAGSVPDALDRLGVPRRGRARERV